MTTDLDLTEAVDAAARALYDREAVRYRERNHGEEPPPFDAVSPLQRHGMREAVLPLITAAAPIIAAQVRAETLREAADAWTQGAWADTPRRADRVVERIAAAQYVGDWLRALASAPTEEAGRG